MQANPQSTAYKGAYVEVSKVPEEEIPVHRRKTFRQKYFSGIKRTLRAFLAVAVIVLIVNVSWLGYGMSEYGIIDGFGTIKEGKCTEGTDCSDFLSASPFPDSTRLTRYLNPCFLRVVIKSLINVQ